MTYPRLIATAGALAFVTGYLIFQVFGQSTHFEGAVQGKNPANAPTAPAPMRADQ